MGQPLRWFSVQTAFKCTLQTTKKHELRHGFLHLCYGHESPSVSVTNNDNSLLFGFVTLNQLFTYTSTLIEWAIK